jgi:hypothetical protein
MHVALSSKQTEADQKHTDATQKSRRVKQSLQYSLASTYFLSTFPVGNQPPPWLRSSTEPQASDEQPAQFQEERRVPVEEHPPQRTPSPSLQFSDHQVPPGLRLSTLQLAGQGQAVPLEDIRLRNRKENTTSLPDTLKAGVEQLSGLSLDDVQVHYNSAKPAEVQALAYTQGTDIHVGPGQEQHLAHEAWHVVQQMQGRVKPTMQMKTLAINDDESLEQEADKLGARAAQSESVSPEQLGRPLRSDSDLIQRAKRKAPLPPPRPPSKRQKRLPLDTIFAQMPAHFEGPHYTSETVHAYAGGKRSEAVLSPVCHRGLGTDANPNLPQAIIPARANYPLKNFKAGHLLNADFFGSGQNANNLTILTASANTTMTTFDNNIKNAVAELKKLYTDLYNTGKDISILEFGIEVVVEVSATKWGPNYPDNCITTEVTCSASLDGDEPDFTASQQTLHDNIVTYINIANGVSPIDNR